MGLDDPGDNYQDLVVWSLAGHAADGSPKVNLPKEIPGHYPESQTLDINPEGEVVNNTTPVIVYEDISLGSIIWLGPMCNLPDPVTNLMEVVGFTKTPGLKNLGAARNIQVKRYGGSLPPLAS